MNTHTSRLNYVPNYAKEWGNRHLSAIRNPNKSEAGIVGMLRAWLEYADQHKARFESGIGEDRFLGPEWATMGKSLRTLLNDELGRLDGGTLDSIICEALTAEGFNPENI